MHGTRRRHFAPGSLRNQAACSAAVLPRNWARFSNASMSVCCTTSDGSTLSARTDIELKTDEELQIIAKPLQALCVRKIK